MICHVVLIRLRAGISKERTHQFLSEAENTLGPIPGVKDLRIGQGLGIKDERDFPLCLVMNFSDEDALEGYQVHPEHLRFVKEILGPIGDDKKVFDYRC